MSNLICACCTAPLLPEQAAPAPADEPLRYHRDFNDCLAYTIARLAVDPNVPPEIAAAAMAMIAAVVGWTGEDDRG